MATSGRYTRLSGCQRLRVAIARALAGNPTPLLAGEPTGALDQKTGRQVMALFRELNAEGRTIIMITHDMNVARNARRALHIPAGREEEEAERGIIVDISAIADSGLYTVRTRPESDKAPPLGMSVEARIEWATGSTGGEGRSAARRRCAPMPARPLACIALTGLCVI